MIWQDDPVRRPLLAAILDAARLPLEQPPDAAAAMAAAAAPAAVALVLDANVTSPSGAEFLRELRHRRRGRPLPTVAVLQPGQACLRSAMRGLGVERLVSEPFRPDELVAAVMASLEASGSPG